MLTPRRILHISTRLILGGSQENTVLSCEGQARLGHRVDLAFGPIFGPEGSSLERVLAFNERCRSGQERVIDSPRAVRAAGEAVLPIGVHEVRSMVRQVAPLTDRRGYLELIALIERLKPDLVHTHSSKAGILGRWAARRARERAGATVPGIVHTIHGPPFNPLAGGPLNRLKIGLVNWAYTLAERSAAGSCEVIVSVADAMTRQFLARGIGAPGQYRTVYSGMEIDRYLHARGGLDSADGLATRHAVGLGADDFVIGTVARLAEQKGHDDLLTALAPELAVHPEWKLLWVGDGWWRERLMARVDAMGLRGRVITTGLVPSEDVARHMRAMDVLVHPSVREGLPRTVPQALLCGRPVVAYDVDGTGEACIEGVTGKLVKAGDLEGLRRAVSWMYDHPQERRAMAERGLAICRERFSADAMVLGLEAVYDEALARAGGHDGRGAGAHAATDGGTDGA